MGLRSWFSRSARTPDSFADVKEVTTRKLPLPCNTTSRDFVVFSAKKEKDGRWSLHGYYAHTISPKISISQVAAAFSQVILKNVPPSTPVDLKKTRFNFDQIFLILKEMEETMLCNNQASTEVEPPNHYMAAYRLLPKVFRETLADMYAQNLEKGRVLPPKPQSGGSSPYRKL